MRESYVNIITSESNNEVDLYKSIIYDMLQKSYSSIGGIYGLKNADALVSESDLWKIDKTNDHVNAVAVYTFKRTGRKLQYACSDGTDYGKSRLYKIISDDIKQANRNAWAEVSGKMEHIYLKNGAIPLPIEIVKKLMPDKHIYELTDEDISEYEGRNNINDGFHYKRIIGNYSIIKLCVYSGKDF